MVVAHDPAGDPPPAGDDPAAQLELQSGQIGWSELARHFARGVVLHASSGADLIVVAECMVADDVDGIGRLLDTGELVRASDGDARDWVAREPVFRCVVVAPWVLVQELQ